MKKSFIVLTPLLFIFSCYVAASDAQGAILFLFTLPIMFLMSGLGFMWMREKKLKLVQNIFLGYIIYLSLFVLTAFLPGPFSLPSHSIRAVSKTFEFFTGETPYARERRKSKN
jgi:cytochrome c oxidase subunit IV